MISSLCTGMAAVCLSAAGSSAVAAEFVDYGQVTYQTVVSDGGFFSCSFFGEGTGMPGTVKSDGTYDYRASAFSSAQMDAVMRAVNTLEKTFVFATGADGKPVRQAQLRFAISKTLLSPSVAAAADPIVSFEYNGLTLPRTKWLASDFGGRMTGKDAFLNNLESVLKYGADVFYTPITEAVPEWYRQSSAGKGDAYIVFNANQFDSNGDAGPLLQSMESVALHELGHTMGFMHNVNSAMGAFMEQADFWGEKTYVFNGETAMKYNGGEKPRMDNLAMDHLAPEYGAALMNKYPRNQGQTTFSDLDLAMFQDMGWTIRDSAWSVSPTVPEPCSATLLAAGALCVAWRRRRRGMMPV